MAAVIAMVTLVLAVGYWLMSPLSALLTPLVELHALPWVLLGGTLLWLLAG
ncbi:MAG: hypothetical protein ACO24U_05540 [Prochlorococcaceae cyanobacterium]